LAEFPSPVGDSAQVLFDQTVPRHLVHRAAVSEVFLTDLRVTDEATFQVGAQWPRDHSFFRLASAKHHDPMLLAETIRQAALVIAHRVFDVPHEWKFLSHETNYSVSPAGVEMGPRPADILLSVTCQEIKRRGTAVTGAHMEIGCYREGEWIGSGEVRWSCVSPAAYKRLRGARDVSALDIDLPYPVVPRAVGRERARDVVLSPMTTSNTWQLRYDLNHPVLFDHPVDHVPGMVLMEAARQAAMLKAGRTDVLPIGCRFTFDKYVELAKPTVVTALSSGMGVKVVFDQDGHRVAHGTIDMTPLG
jgi:hypothetical protein